MKRHTLANQRMERLVELRWFHLDSLLARDRLFGEKMRSSSARHAEANRLRIRVHAAVKLLRRLSEIFWRADLLRLFFKFEKYGHPFPVSEPGVVRLHLLLPFGYRMHRVVSPMPELLPKFKKS